MSDALLLDTHTFLWWIGDDTRLSTAAARAISAGDTVLLSVASAWEIAIKASLGRIDMPRNLSRFLAEQIRRNGFTILPIRLNHAAHTAGIENHHHDPFDRLLIAQAMIENATLVTCDPLVRRYPVRTLW